MNPGNHESQPDHFASPGGLSGLPTNQTQIIKPNSVGCPGSLAFGDPGNHESQPDHFAIPEGSVRIGEYPDIGQYNGVSRYLSTASVVIREATTYPFLSHLAAARRHRRDGADCCYFGFSTPAKSLTRRCCFSHLAAAAKCEGALDEAMQLRVGYHDGQVALRV